MNTKRFTITEVCRITGLAEPTLHMIIEKEWITPCGEFQFDHEDVARLHLILELEHQMGVNEDAIPIILHLIDQLHYLRGRLKSAGTTE